MTFFLALEQRKLFPQSDIIQVSKTRKWQAEILCCFVLYKWNEKTLVNLNFYKPRVKMKTKKVVNRKQKPNLT